MPAPTLPDSREEKDTNPIQQRYDENPGTGYVSSGQDQLEAFANDPANSTAKNLSDTEAGASGAAKVNEDVRDNENAPGGWKVNRSENGSGEGFNKPKLDKAITFAKKRGGILGLIALFGVSGGIIASFLGPASMIINLMENASITNDSSSTVLERRFLKVLGHATKKEDPICANRTNSLKCRMGKISNSAIDKLERKGVKAIFADDVDNNARKKTGYPTKNPTSYEFDIDGVKTQVPANELIDTLRNNPKMAAKVLGRGGAINLRLSNWGGRHITQQFLNKFGLKKDGGIADGKNGKLSAQERYKAALEKIRARSPGNEKFNGAVERVRGKVEGHLGKAQKGGSVYMIAVAGCIGVKAPGYIASAVAAVQLAQIMPFAMDLVLSPGSKSQISGIDTANSVTGEDMDTIGSLATQKTPRESDGKMTSMNDSQYLQASTNTNTSQPPVSKDYAPGYSVLTSDIVVAAQQADEATAESCNVILSPAAMWSAFAVSSAVTIASGPFGIVKFVGDLAISYVAGEVAKEVAGAAAEKIVTDFAKNGKIPGVQGEALGDVTGIALSAFFSAGAASRHLPVMKASQFASFQKVAQENEAFKRDMDIASLSPLDVSSKYTFLGSIANSMKIAVMNNSTYNGSFSSILSSVAQLPFKSLSVNAGAVNYSSSLCGYADDFKLEAGDNTPCLTQAGTPYYGMTDQQLAMSTDQALNLTEGWFDEGVTIDDSYNISDMVGKAEDSKAHYIKADTPLAEFINSCSDLSTGDYIYSAPGCTVDSASPTTTEDGQCYTNSEGKQTCANSSNEQYVDPSIETTSSDSLAAMSVTLVDFQVNQMLNGTDIGNGPAGTDPNANPGAGTPLVGRPDGAIDVHDGWELADNGNYTQYPCNPPSSQYSESYKTKFGATVRLCAVPDELVGNYCLASVGQPLGEYSGYNGCNLVSSVIYDNFVNMLKAARAAGHKVSLNDGMRLVHNAGYRSIHTYGTAADIGIDSTPICSQGVPSWVSGWGDLSGAQNACRSIGGQHYAAYEWLNNNAANYGFYNFDPEPWHWSSSGK